MATATRPKGERKAKVAVPAPLIAPVPDWLPPVVGFWAEPYKDGLAWRSWDERTAWAKHRLTDSASRCAAACFARRVLHLFERRHPEDTRPRKAITVAERFAFGLATDDERREARSAAAAYADAAAAAAAYAAAYADAYADAAAADAAAYAADAAYADAYAAAAYADAAAADADAYAAAYAAAAYADAAAADADAYAAERMNQARLMTLFVAPAVPVVTEAIRGLAHRWQESWWSGHDDPVRAILADAMEEEGFEDAVRLQAMRELPAWSLGMWPMVPNL